MLGFFIVHSSFRQSLEGKNSSQKVKLTHELTPFKYQKTSTKTSCVSVGTRGVREAKKGVFTAKLSKLIIRYLYAFREEDRGSPLDGGVLVAEEARPPQ